MSIWQKKTTTIRPLTAAEENKRLERRIQRYINWNSALAKTLLAALVITSGGIGCNAPTGKNHYILAERLFNDKKYKAAVEEFQKVIDSDPRSALSQQALFRSGIIQYLYLDGYADAIKSFKQFIVLSQNAELVFQAEKNIGEVYFSKLEDYRLAVDQYQKLRAKYPNSPERDFFLIRIAKASYGSLDFGNAISTYQELLSSYPNSSYAAEAQYQIGNTYYTKGDTELAIRAFNKVIEKYPNSQQAVFAQFGIGNCLEEKEQTDEALEVYTKILERHPARNVVEAKIKRLNEKKAR